jgi:alpha-tubulin suppressor-like RCC1 family protein
MLNFKRVCGGWLLAVCALGGAGCGADEAGGEGHELGSNAVALTQQERWQKLSLGGDYSCGLDIDGGIWCWGLNSRGQLGNGTVVSTNKPSQIASAVSSWKDLKAGWNHACAIDQNNKLYCWGAGGFGATGQGVWTDALTPVAVPGMGNVLAFGTGGDVTCAIKQNGSLWCWGINAHSQLGDGTVVSQPSPIKIGTNNNWTTVSPGNGHTCAQRSNGRSYCWGHNLNGQVGIGVINGNNEETIQQISGNNNLGELSSFHYTTCALRSTNKVACWGLNNYGQIGNGTLNDALTGTLVNLSRRATQVSAGNAHSCAVLNNGKVQCWGMNIYGQLGVGTETTSESTPVTLPLSNVKSIHAGGIHSCAVLNDDSALCWGHNWAGQLGDGTNTKTATPVAVLPRGS